MEAAVFSKAFDSTRNLEREKKYKAMQLHALAPKPKKAQIFGVCLFFPLRRGFKRFFLFLFKGKNMKTTEPTLEELVRKIEENGKRLNIQRLKKALEIGQESTTEFSNRKKEAHVLGTAFIIAESGLDEETIIASLLHHALREKKFSKEQLEAEFGKEITALVEGVDKIDTIESRKKERLQPELASKLMLATAKDIRIIFIRLAARLDALRALDSLPKEEQKETAQTALDVYVPICHKLGLHKMRWEIEDLAMRALNREEYEKIKKEIKQTREEREQTAEETAKFLEAYLKQKGIGCRVFGRAKNFYRVNKKMADQNKKFSEIFDLLAYRVICNTENECYEALAALQDKFEQIESEFNDYIKKPKPNGYQSVHAVFLINNMPMEVQIRTWEMHKNAEDGLAAHWQYKQYKKDRTFDARLSIAKQLTDWQHAAKDSNELIENMHLKFEGNKVFVFTPKNEIMELDEGSTPVDFAFALHSNIGLKCERAKANGKIVPLNYVLENGDTVEIMTSEKQTPKQQWLPFVKTEKAKTRIRQALGLPAATKPKGIIQAIKTIVGLSEKAKQNARTAKCCNPLPGDKITGVKTTKRKIVIHRADCKNIIGLPESKKTAVPDSLFEKGGHEVILRIEMENRPGALPEILTLISSFRITVNSTNAKLQPNNTMACLLNIQIKNISELEKLLEKTRSSKGVRKAERETTP